MRAMGVNRVVIAVKDLDRAVALYSRLLGATFHEANPEDAAAHGVKVAMSWDAGIELACPLPDRDSPIKKLIETRGEGIMGVVFNVDDVDECKATAEQMGIGVLAMIADYSQEEIDKYLQGRFKKYKEYMLNPAQTCGVGPIVGQIELK